MHFGTSIKILKNLFFQRNVCDIPGLIYHSAAASHQGHIRSVNEDSYLAFPEHGLWVLADGMGGHEQGERASRIAVEEIAKQVLAGKTIRESIKSGHSAVRAASRGEGGKAAIGTTVVVARLIGLHYQIAWVGDSRAYLWDTGLRQLTVDHSYVQMLLDGGMLSKEEASVHPKKNVLLHALGLPPNVEGPSIIDLTEGRLRMQDSLLLCSDGLHGEISDEQMQTILANTDDNELRVQRLIEAALQAGGRDNITVIAISPGQFKDLR